MNLFGRAKASKTVEAPKQIDTVAHISMLQENITHIEKQIQHCETQIRSFQSQALERKRKGDVHGARLFMKRVLRQQEQQKKFFTWIDNLESQKEMLTAQTQNVAYVRTMGSTTTVMKQMAASMSPDMVDKLREDHEEAVADFEEVDSMLKESWVSNTVSDADLDAQLEALSAGEMDAAMSTVDMSAIGAPAAPTGPISTGAAAAAAPAAAPLPHMPDAPVGAISVPAAAAAPAASVADALAMLEASM